MEFELTAFDRTYPLVIPQHVTAYGFSYSDICTHAMIRAIEIYNELATELRDDLSKFSEMKAQYKEGCVEVRCNHNREWLMRISHCRSEISVVYIKDNIWLPLGPMTSVKCVQIEMGDSHVRQIVDGIADLEDLHVTVPKYSSIHIMNCPNLTSVTIVTVDPYNYNPQMLCDFAPRNIYGKPKVHTKEFYRVRDFGEQAGGEFRGPVGN